MPLMYYINILNYNLCSISKPILAKAKEDKLYIYLNSFYLI